MVDLSARVLKSYLIREIAPRLGSEFKLYGRRGLYRVRGPVVQSLVLSASRGTVLVVSPGLFVCGYDPNFPVLSGSMSLYALDSHKWSFVRPELSAEFAEQLVGLLREDRSPLSFFAEISDHAIEAMIKFFISHDKIWFDLWALAFFNMVRGSSSARDDLDRALVRFRAKGMAHPPRDLDKAFLERLSDLEARLDRPDCIALCRAEAEQHAVRLNLPTIDWPPEWPLTTPPWPRQPKGLWRRLFD